MKSVFVTTAQALVEREQGAIFPEVYYIFRKILTKRKLANYYNFRPDPCLFPVFQMREYRRHRQWVPNNGDKVVLNGHSTLFNSPGPNPGRSGTNCY